MRILHVMLRVSDLERSVEFYRSALGMQLLRKSDFPEGKFSLAFLGYGTEERDTVIELTHNWAVPEYRLGDGYGHIAIGVDDVYATCAHIKSNGGVIVREPGPMKHGTRVLAFATDPDGYQIELLEESS